MTSGCAVGFTGSPSEVSASGARVSGTVVSSVGGTTSYWVEFGPTTAYGSETTHQSVVVAKNTPWGVSAQLLGLQRATTYHYRLCAATRSRTRLGASAGAIAGWSRRASTAGRRSPPTCASRATWTAAGQRSQGGPQRVGDRCRRSRREPRRLQHHRGDIRRRGRQQGHRQLRRYDDLVVRNGSIGGWGVAIHIEGASRNAISSVDAQGSPNGVFISGGVQNEIRRSSVTGRETGILAQSQQGLRGHRQ